MELVKSDNQIKSENLRILYKTLDEQHIPIKWKNVTFAGLSIPSNLNPQQKMNFIALLEKIRDIDIYNCGKIVTLSSKSNGIGKTHLLFCLYKKFIWDCIQAGNKPSAKFTKEYDFFLDIQETFKPSVFKSEKEVIEEYTSKRKLLAIDDLFATKDTDFGRQRILMLLDKRSDHFGYPTIITTNLSLQEINDIDSRIASRIDNEYFFDLSGLAIDFRKFN